MTMSDCMASDMLLWVKDYGKLILPSPITSLFSVGACEQHPVQAQPVEEICKRLAPVWLSLATSLTSLGHEFGLHTR